MIDHFSVCNRVYMVLFDGMCRIGTRDLVVKAV